MWGQTGRSPVFLSAQTRQETGVRPVCPHISRPTFPVGWFQSLWRDSTVPREYLFRLKSMLRELCIENEVPQDQMVGAVLEHLFETPEIAEFFSDWRTDSRLKRAYDLAMEWAEDHRPSNPPQA